MEAYITFPCVKVEQPIGEFYIGSINAQDLVQISFADVRRIEDEQRDIEKYLGIQRPLSAGRIGELKEYVKTVDATFPTGVIIAVSSEDAEFDLSTHTMKIKLDQKVAKIIDGQHRVAGLEGFDGKFQINVTLFVDMDIENQAMVFATINLKQTKVSKSLAYDLYDLAKTRSPQKTCHDIARLLNSRDDSPLFGRIKILGVATGKPNETLTQATVVDRLLRLITNEPMTDRDLLKRGNRPERALGADRARFIFRNMFLDQKDGEIARSVWNYFTAIENRWPQAWGETKRGLILNRTTGFGALMRFLPKVYEFLGRTEGLISVDEYGEVFKLVDIDDTDFTSSLFPPGSSGEAELVRRLSTAIGTSKNR